MPSEGRAHQIPAASSPSAVAQGPPRNHDEGETVGQRDLPIQGTGPGPRQYYVPLVEQGKKSAHHQRGQEEPPQHPPVEQGAGQALGDLAEGTREDKCPARAQRAGTIGANTRAHGQIAWMHLKNVITISGLDVSRGKRLSSFGPLVGKGARCRAGVTGPGQSPPAGPAWRIPGSHGRGTLPRRGYLPGNLCLGTPSPPLRLGYAP